MPTNSCCNKSIPNSTKTSLVLRPNGKMFVNGISNSYEIKYFEELKPYIDDVEYNHIMDRLVDGMMMMWPCDLCYTFGYICSICTLGLSFLCPNICIHEAVKSFLEDIDNINEDTFHKHNLHLSLKRKCCTSWLQIDITDPNIVNTNNNLNTNGNINCNEEYNNNNYDEINNIHSGKNNNDNKAEVNEHKIELINNQLK